MSSTPSLSSLPKANITAIKWVISKLILCLALHFLIFYIYAHFYNINLVYNELLNNWCRTTTQYSLHVRVLYTWLANNVCLCIFYMTDCLKQAGWIFLIYCTVHASEAQFAKSMPRFKFCTTYDEYMHESHMLDICVQ